MEDIKNIENEERDMNDEDMTDEEIAIADLVNDLLFEIDTEDVPVDTFWSNIVVKLGEINLSYDCVVDINNELSFITIGDIVLKVTASIYEDDDDAYGSFDVEESSKEELLRELNKKLIKLHSEIDKIDNLKRTLTSN